MPAAETCCLQEALARESLRRTIHMRLSAGQFRGAHTAAWWRRTCRALMWLQPLRFRRLARTVSICSATRIHGSLEQGTSQHTRTHMHKSARNRDGRLALTEIETSRQLTESTFSHSIADVFRQQRSIHGRFPVILRLLKPISVKGHTDELPTHATEELACLADTVRCVSGRHARLRVCTRSGHLKQEPTANRNVALVC